MSKQMDGRTIQTLNAPNWRHYNCTTAYDVARVNKPVIKIGTITKYLDLCQGSVSARALCGHDLNVKLGGLSHDG